jgi:UDP-glucose 4-epimerase
MNDSTLIVGANGFIGSRLTQYLAKKGHKVVAYCGRYPEAANISWLPLDTPFTSPAFATAGTVVWAAGASTPASSTNSPDLEYERNLRPLLAFMEASRQWTQRRVVFLSTGGAIYGDIETGTAHERSPTEPKSYYSAGKAAAEAFLTAWAHQAGHDVTILRPSNVYGSGQPYKIGFGIVPTAFHAIRTNDPVIIRGDGHAVRDYLHVDDLMELTRKVVMKPFAPGAAVYNASSNEGTSLNSLFSLIRDATGHTVPCTYRPSRTFDVSRIVLDNGLARSTFRWAPEVELSEGLIDAWTHFQ